MGEQGLSLRHISRSINGTNILHDISLDMREGEFLTLVGPSGCGKSTLLRLIAGLERQNNGEIWMKGKRIDALRPSQRDVAMVFQSYALYPHMSVRGNISVPLMMRYLTHWQRLPLIGYLSPAGRRERKRIKKKVEAAADMFGMRPLLARKPAHLSGGQRQRVALARAMVREPILFLMDEPLSNLDAAMRTQARAEIALLHRRLKTSFIYVTHDQAEAMTMSDRVAVMLEGRLQQIDTPEALYAKPATIKVAEFIGTPQINILPAVVKTDGKVDVLGYTLPIKLDIPLGYHIFLGIRPEVLSLSQTGIAAHVHHVENLGSELLVHANVAGQPHNHSLIARLDPYQNKRPALGSLVHFAPKGPHVLIFDTAGKRLALQQESI